MTRLLLLLCLVAGLTSCFQPSIPISRKVHYPVDVFYDNQRPERPFQELQPLKLEQEDALQQRTVRGRMVNRGNDMQAKEMMLTKLAMQAKRLGADALIGVRYHYYTSVSTNGYSMEGVAVKYRAESE